MLRGELLQVRRDGWSRDRQTKEEHKRTRSNPTDSPWQVRPLGKRFIDRTCPASLEWSARQRQTPKRPLSGRGPTSGIESMENFAGKKP